MDRTTMPGDKFEANKQNSGNIRSNRTTMEAIVSRWIPVRHRVPLGITRANMEKAQIQEKNYK
jgi:hypothetical protein